MNKTWRNIGIVIVIAGALFYPAFKLYQYIAKKRAESDVGEDEKAPKKTMRLLHHKRHTPHPLAPHNGHANPSVG